MENKCEHNNNLRNKEEFGDGFSDNLVPLTPLDLSECNDFIYSLRRKKAGRGCRCPLPDVDRQGLLCCPDIIRGNDDGKDGHDSMRPDRKEHGACRDKHGGFDGAWVCRRHKKAAFQARLKIQRQRAAQEGLQQGL